MSLDPDMLGSVLLPKITVKHAAAQLAVVTHLANNQKVPVQRPDGTWGTRIARDAQ